jgi:hypothetical protein
MLSHDLAMALDPVLYARSAGFTLDPWQQSVVRSQAPRVALNITRQGGKSTAAAVKAMHMATYNSDALILLLSPGLRQSAELFRKCAGVRSSLSNAPEPASETKLSMELLNGSRIISLPGSEASIRGYSGPALILVDEASRVPDEVYKAVRPMLARSRGQLVTLSTPFGKRGWYFSEWVSKRPWERYSLTAAECPHITPEFLEEERDALGEYFFAQEYELAFHDPESAAFQRAYIDAAIDESVEQWDLIQLEDLKQQLGLPR